MFYSHEVLTSRKYGVATIWLVATLGSQSRTKRILRRDIQKVDVPGACETIIAPETPMALRLQSNLLYGVTRVYNHQCIYVLTDTQSCYNNMKALLRTMHQNASTIDLDNSAKTTRPEQLLLQDDPNFAAELLLDLDGLDLDLDLGPLSLPDLISSQGSAGLSSLNTPPEAGSSQAGMPQIEIPSSVGSSGGVGGFHIGGSVGRESNRLSDLARSEDGHGLLDDVGFTFDADGNMLDSNEGMDLSTDLPATPNKPQNAGGKVPSDLSAQARDRARRRDTEANESDNTNLGMGMDLDNLPFPRADNNADYPDAQPFSPRPRPQTDEDRPAATDDTRHFSFQNQESDPSSASAPLAARARRPHGPRPLLPDNPTTLSSATARSWQANYLANMAIARATKLTHSAPALAKKNADFWVWGRGIGGVGAELGPLGADHPLSVFFGEKLRVRLVGEAEGSRKRSGEKNARVGENEDGDGSDSADRRVRQRLEAEVGMSTDMDLGNNAADDGPLAPSDDALEDTQFPDPEVGRTAPTPPPFARDDGAGLDTDLSSTMPWNISASHRSRSQSQQQQLSRRGLAGSAIAAGGPAGAAGTARGGRLTSASPLHGRGSALALTGTPMSRGVGMGISSSAAGDGDLNDLGGTGFPDNDDDDDENDGTDPNLSPQERDRDRDRIHDGTIHDEAQQGAQTQVSAIVSSQAARAALDAEAENFLRFVADAAEAKGESREINSSTFALARQEKQRGEQDDEEAADHTTIEVGIKNHSSEQPKCTMISFDALLPPDTNSALVVAQALLHVLTLASKGVMVVEQESGEVFEDIGARLWVGLRSGEGEVVVEADGEDEAMESGQNEIDGQAQERGGDEVADEAGSEGLEDDDEEEEDELTG